MTLATRTWWEDDPVRLEQEMTDVRGVAPLLQWTAEGAGYFEGPLPLWPFARPAPAEISDLVDPFVVRVEYTHAFPAAPPQVVPLIPQPAQNLRGFTQFHVLPSGRLCLLRDADQWYPWSQTSELLRKASGWAIEFSLLEKRRIAEMTTSGIAFDDCLDPIIVKAVEEFR